MCAHYKNCSLYLLWNDGLALHRVWDADICQEFCVFDAPHTDIGTSLSIHNKSANDFHTSPWESVMCTKSKLNHPSLQFALLQHIAYHSEIAPLNKIPIKYELSSNTQADSRCKNYFGSIDFCPGLQVLCVFEYDILYVRSLSLNFGGTTTKPSLIHGSVQFSPRSHCSLFVLFCHLI
jgi:hypothetical protein